MGIGVSVFLLAVGAIVAFAVDVRVGWVDLDVVGWVLMACGLIGLIFTLSVLSRRRRTVVSPAPGATVAEREVVDEGPAYDVNRPL